VVAGAGFEPATVRL